MHIRLGKLEFFDIFYVKEEMHMINPNIEDYICRELLVDEQKVALDFIGFLRDNNLVFYKDNCECWKNKIYYWVKSGDECICFIAIKDPDKTDNHWTVWSDDMGSAWLEQSPVDNVIKEIAWNRIDHCGHCGSCGGGRHKVIFGKEFDDVCGCTFRIDNPTLSDLFFLKKMVEIRLKEINNQQQ